MRKDYNMNIEQIKTELQNVLSLPFICVYDKGEDLYIVQIFNAKGNKENYKNIIYDLEDKIFPNQESSFSVIVYNTKETKQYFPDYLEYASQKFVI